MNAGFDHNHNDDICMRDSFHYIVQTRNREGVWVTHSAHNNLHDAMAEYMYCGESYLGMSIRVLTVEVKYAYIVSNIATLTEAAGE